uniref:DegT/DnrJ/EryC1/StrS family aminotransferase n=1 Tax=Ningiella ruwaisensis TaxID=2364274 RepID=UPI00109F0891|nr:DegT/DnrJ/EryC1/StrS aminotransferase family protein [Ningiella ruwaisensis]
MLNGPFTPWPYYCDEEKNAVLAILDSNRVNYWTGNSGREFEKEFARFADSEYAVAVANGSVALDLAWKALDMPPGSEIIVTSRTFLASVSSIVLAGYVPVFADISRDSQNITYDTVKQCITEKTACILCVHLAGWPCEMDDLLKLAKEHHLYVVEDCAQAHGAKYKGRSVGSIGDIGAWSFCQDKIISTAGEGGMVTTNNKSYWEKIWSYKDHGKSYSAVYEQSHPPGFRWLHESFGTNWRMTEIQSAVGRVQLQKMHTWISKRTHYAEAIFDVARNFSGIRVPEIPDYIEHSFYKCYVFVEPECLQRGWDRDRIMDEINQRGVPCFSGSCSEVYLEKAFENTTYRPKNRLPVAKELGETSLMFLVHPTLTEEEIEKTCIVIKEVFSEACQQ